ncbi:MAG TPA: hypothetical protein PLZ52_10325 [Bacteroidales bacterium]|nr:hypothetical protein [Bacteroidales bacterium]HQL71002.1 hypothetical protein [Bacteroidales bacterium]
MKSLFFSLLMIASVMVSGQSAKEARENNIKTRTVVKTIEQNGVPFTFTETVEQFNKNGKTISKTEYSKSGKVKSEQTFKYDSFGNVTEETEKDTKDNTYFVIKYTYNADGDKVSETKTDGSGNVIEKITYSYNNKGLRTEKKVYDSSGVVKSVRKTTYEYYK